MYHTMGKARMVFRLPVFFYVDKNMGSGRRSTHPAKWLKLSLSLVKKSRRNVCYPQQARK